MIEVDNEPWVDAMDIKGKWWEATVISQCATSRTAHVRFCEWGPEWDETVSMDACIAPLHTYTTNWRAALTTGSYVEYCNIRPDSRTWVYGMVIERDDDAIRVLVVSTNTPTNHHLPCSEILGVVVTRVSEYFIAQPGTHLVPIVHPLPDIDTCPISLQEFSGDMTLTCVGQVYNTLDLETWVNHHAVDPVTRLTLPSGIRGRMDVTGWPLTAIRHAAAMLQFLLKTKHDILSSVY